MNDLSDLRTSVNKTARMARGTLLLLLVVGLYLAIIVAGTDDLLLLKQGEIALPLMQASVPVDLFYAAGPAVLLLLHVKLFLRFGQLSLRAGMLRARIEEFDRIERTRRETALLYPFEFLQLLMYRTSRGTDKPEPPNRAIWARLAYENEKFGNIVPLLALVGLVVCIVPMGLLIAMQVRFLPYQHEAITLFQQIVVTLDVVMQAVFLGLYRYFPQPDFRNETVIVTQTGRPGFCGHGHDGMFSGSASAGVGGLGHSREFAGKTRAIQWSHGRNCVDGIQPLVDGWGMRTRLPWGPGIPASVSPCPRPVDQRA